MHELHITPKNKTALSLLGILIFIFFCLLELKAIYWAALDSSKAFSLLNVSALIVYFLLNLFSLSILIAKVLHFKKLVGWIDGIKPGSWLKWALAFLICLFPVWFFSFSAWGLVFISPVLHAWCFASVVVLVSWLITDSSKDSFSFECILPSILMVGGIFLIGNKFKEVVDYPFSLYWSEGNRFWDYSLLFGRNIYLYPQSQPIFAFIDLGRQSLWGLPFLFGKVSIIGMRLWNVLLFTLVYFLLGYLIFKRKNTSISLALLMGLWAFTFLNQGPIYTPLILSAMLVWVAGEAPLAVSLLLLTAAGYYANLTRYTWSVAPAIWGVMLALFHTKYKNDIPSKVDWLRVIGSGLAGLFGGIILPMLFPLANNGSTQDFQGAVVGSAASTLKTQELIWSRLWPNETFTPGIVLGIVLAVLPLVLILIMLARQSKIKLNIWQLLALIGSSLAFLAVGLIASVKIGGGSNLHNLDMLFINLLFLGGLAWKKKGQDWLFNLGRQSLYIQILTLLLVIYPLFPTILNAYPLDLPSREQQNNVLSSIQKSVNEAKNIEPVLFIDQRQLLTFGMIKDVPLIPEYEKKYLMDRAMSGDKEYFMKFYDDLRNHRFSLIINEPSYIEYQAEDVSFGTENDVWVDWIAEPILCYYRILENFKVPSVELLIPRIFPPDPSWKCP